MDASENRANNYRARADEIRTIARGMSDDACRNVLLAVASDYEYMASRFESLERTFSGATKPDAPLH